MTFGERDRSSSSTSVPSTTLLNVRSTGPVLGAAGVRHTRLDPSAVQDVRPAADDDFGGASRGLGFGRGATIFANVLPRGRELVFWRLNGTSQVRWWESFEVEAARTEW